MRHFKKIDWPISLFLLFACVLTVIAACVEPSGPLGAPNFIEAPTVSSVRITLAQSALAPGQTTQATVVATSADGKVVSGRVDFLSQNPSLATVSSTGTVMAVAPGSATIQGTISGTSGSASLTVVQVSASPNLRSHDFNDGTIGPYKQVPGLDADSTDFPDDPTNSGHGKVARMLFNPIDNGALNSNDEGVAYAGGSTHLRYGQTIWMRGEVYLPSSGESLHQQGDTRKLIDWGGAGGARMIIARGWSETYHKLMLYLSCNDAMGTGTIAETVFENTGIELTDDAWYTIEVKMATNSADNVRDGVLEIYINGAATPTYRRTTGIGWITEKLGGSYFNYYKTGSQLSIQYPIDPAYVEYRYWDNIGFSTTRIGR